MMTDVVVRLAQWAENDMKAEGIAIEAKHAIEELRKDVTAFWNEMELMRSDLSIYAEEIERLRKALGKYDCLHKCTEPCALYHLEKAKEDTMPHMICGWWASEALLEEK